MNLNCELKPKVPKGQDEGQEEPRARVVVQKIGRYPTMPIAGDCSDVARFLLLIDIILISLCIIEMVDIVPLLSPVLALMSALLVLLNANTVLLVEIIHLQELLQHELQLVQDASMSAARNRRQVM